MNKDKKEEFIHEALDRAHMASMHLQMALEDHVVILDYEDVKEVYENAVEKIEQLYQLIGSKL